MLNKIKSLVGLGDKKELYLRPLKERDIEDIMAIESQVYSYPWKSSIFKDCLRVGYSNWAFIKNEQFIGYAILSIAAGEAHILNICINPIFQGQGLGKLFLGELFQVVKERKVACVFLEVRPSNTPAVNLYNDVGFKQIGVRKDYYPAVEGREDALVLSFDMA